ncbi:MAG: hypothetical protein V1870_00380 [Candidatus Aenigmatarchaeota archaeon]
MPGRTVSSSADMIMFPLIIGVCFIIFGLVLVQSADVGQKVSIAGAPGVVKSETPSFEYADKDGIRYYMLKILKAEHEEGKVLSVVPVLNVDSFVYRPNSGLTGATYPIFSVPGDIEAVFSGITNIDEGKSVHVSLWEVRCLENIGFTTNNNPDLKFSDLVKKCANAYLTAYDVKLTKFSETQ